MFWYVLFYKDLIVLHHGDNNFLYSFDICIKFTLSLIIWTMKIWQHLTWCLLFYDKNMFVRKKNILPWSNLEVPPFGKFVTEVLFFRSSRSRMFFKIGVLKNLAIFTGKRLCWPLQAFFYREHLRWLLLDFRGSKYFFELNLVFIADSHTGVYSELLWKYE